MQFFGKNAFGYLIVIRFLQIAFVNTASLDSRIKFFRDPNLTDLILESNSTSTCNNLPRNTPIDTKSIQAFSCWVLYQHPNCFSFWKFKVNDATSRFVWTIGSFHSCNEHEGGSQLNVEITEYFAHVFHFTAPKVLESYKDVCTCINIPHYVQELEKWSIDNHGNEVIAYFEPDCSQAHYEPYHIVGGITTWSREIYNKTRVDNFTGTVSKILSFGPNVLSLNFKSRCRYSKIMNLEILEETDNFWKHNNQSKYSRIKLDDIVSQMDFFSDLNFAGSHLKLELTKNCSDLPTYLWSRNEVGSAKADYCVMLYSEQNCMGRSIKLETGRSAVLQENWEQTVISPNTLALLYNSLTGWHWETKSFHLCNSNEGGTELNIDITRYFIDKTQLSNALVLKKYRNVSSCQTLPQYISKLDKWSMNNHGNGIWAYFGTKCLSKTHNPIWIPPGRNSFSMGIGLFKRTNNVTQIFEKIQSIGPGKVNTNTGDPLVYFASSTTEEGIDARTKEPLTSDVIGTSIWVYIGIPVVVLFALIFSTMLVVHWVRLNRIQDMLTPDDVKRFLFGRHRKASSNLQAEEIVTENDALEKPYDASIEIAKNNFEIDWSSPLGSGEFGCVFKAYIFASPDNKKVEVALKMAKDICPKNAVLSILCEIKILSYLGPHPNLVCVKGAYTAEISKGIVYVATDLCALGSIKDYLRKLSRVEKSQVDDKEYQTTSLSCPVKFAQMVSWSHEISCGMEFLAEKHVIHADLAARNVLLTETKMAKISDFGLSRRLYEYTNYVKRNQEPLPWRWMAIEALRKLEFSSQSDVWSYGVILWEIFSMGDVPYPGYSWTMDFLSSLESGLRMKPPPYATPDIYKLMTLCWEIGPQDRPTFSQLKQSFARMQETEYENEVSSQLGNSELDSFE